MFDELARLLPTGMLVDAQDVQQNGSRHQESDGTVMNKSSSKKYPHEVGLEILQLHGHCSHFTM